MVLILLLFDVEEDIALKRDIPHRDVVGVGHRDGLSALQIIKLCPWGHEDEVFAVALYVLHGDVLVELWCVGSHLEPKQVVGLVDLDAAEDDVSVVYRLAAESEASVAKAIFAVLDDDV